ncbi:GNAT family N-acetyltransferase [Acidithiobacillus ferrianus]|uniref:GNAT family N-acetyltransferase n=1 Tax=Acidithiobacillus ferrianus TaxID=2678518 RepID=A0ACD5H977_9PROT
MTITVGFLVFPGIQLLDLAGPYEIFSALSDGDIHLFWKTREPVACSAGMHFYPTTTLGEGPLVDVLCIPGGVGINPLLCDEEVRGWVRRQGSAAQFVTSVCTGALLLGAAGLLAGRRATTHWRYHDLLAEFGAIPVKERVVRDGNLITGGGVTAGIDFGLVLVTALRGQAAAEEIQLALEYAPEPPFQAGRPEDAPKDIVEVVRRRTETLRAERERMMGAWRKIPPSLCDKSQRHDLRTPLVRELRQDDDPAYRSLWRDALQQYAQYFRTAAGDDVPAGIPTRGAEDSFTLGAFEKNALVGIISLERDRGVKLRHKALLFRMFVAPEVAGRGVGKSLLQEALSRAQGIDDLRYIHLTVLERNQRARALYRSLGFVDFALEPEAVRMDADYAGEVQMMRFLRK